MVTVAKYLYSVTPISNVCEVLVLGYSYQPAAAASNARRPPTATALPDRWTELSRGPFPRWKCHRPGPTPVSFSLAKPRSRGPAVSPPRPHRRRRDATRPDPISPAIYASIDPVPPWPWPLPVPVPVEAQGARARNYWLPRIVLATDRGGEELSGLGRSVSSAIKPRLAGMAVCVRVRRRPDDHWIGRHCVRVAARGSCQAMERGGVE